ncbi:MAG: pilin [Oceanospirillaceae bacterium]
MKIRSASFCLGLSMLCLATTSNTVFAKTSNIETEPPVTQLTRSAWLREYLPENTLFYARIPSLWTSLSYKEDSFKYALGNESYVETINKIQKASVQWVGQSEEKIRPLLALLAGQLDGPIEIAVIAAGMTPNVLISANLNYHSDVQVQALIDSLIQAKAIRSKLQHMTDGAGQVLTNLGPVPYRWDSKLKRLNILLNLGGADIQALDNAFAKLTQNISSPMLANEAQMDSSQQGLYVWYNNAATYPLYKAMIPKKSQQQMSMFGVPDMQSLALAWGVRNEKGRLKFMLETPATAGLRALIPTNNNQLDLMTAADPKLAVLLALPSAEQFSKIEATLLKMSPNSTSYTQAKQQIQTKLGFSVEELLVAIGPELIAVADDAGEYSAIKIQDKQKFATIIAKLQLQPGVSLLNREVAGENITYMKLPSLFNTDDIADSTNIPFFIKDVLRKVSTHLYWHFEGDFLIIAELPQVLLDRKVLLTDKLLSNWLATTQKQDLTASTLAVTGAIQDAPKRMYYMYLNLLQMLADITGAEIDTFSLPSARQLALAKTGSLGLQLDSNTENLSLELTFESTPADILMSSSGAASLAGLGIISAVAIPAYQDYTFKAVAASALYSAASIQDRVAVAYLENGRFPNEEEAVQINAEITGQTGMSNKYQSSIEPNTGKITIRFTKKRGKKLLYIPAVNVDSIDWSCQTNLAGSSRPVGCKQSIK